MKTHRRAIAVALTPRLVLSPAVLWAIATMCFALCFMRPAAAIVVEEPKSNLSAINLQTAYGDATTSVYTGALGLPAAGARGTGLVSMQSIRSFVASIRPRSFDCNFRTNSSTGTEHFDVYATLKWHFGRI